MQRAPEPRTTSNLPQSWRAKPPTSPSPVERRPVMQLKPRTIVFDDQDKLSSATFKQNRYLTDAWLLTPCLVALVNSSFKMSATGVDTAFGSWPSSGSI